MKFIKSNILCGLLLAVFYSAWAQDIPSQVQGRVLDQETGSPVISATISHNSRQTLTDNEGYFTISVIQSDSYLMVSALGYDSLRIDLRDFRASEMILTLVPSSLQMKEVIVSTGYYSIPRERATGSFAHIDSEEIKNQPGTDLLERLESLIPSVQFVRKDVEDDQDDPEIRVRGVASILSDRSPLIVVDNFPYYGDIQSIDPSVVESITVLKDAAASSIWGAKAGNGVIVITTKTGNISSSPRFNIRVNSNVNEKPRLYDAKNFIPAADFIELERTLFERGYYAENNWTALSPVVEMLIEQREGRISTSELEQKLNELRGYDYRDHVSQHMLQNPISTEYVANLSGGGTNFRYMISGGLVNGSTMYKGNNSSRYHLTSSTSFSLSQKLEFDLKLNYAKSAAKNTGLTLAEISASGKVVPLPYTQLLDQEGNPLPVLKNASIRTRWLESPGASHLIDWQYYPLLDIENRQTKSAGENLLVSANLKYSISDLFQLSAHYKHESNSNSNYQDFGPNSYYIRNLVNVHLQTDGTLPYPQIGYRDANLSSGENHHGRIQLNYNQGFNSIGLSIYALAGVEAGQHIENHNRSMLHGFNPDTYTVIDNLDNVTRFRANPRGNLVRLPQSRYILDQFTSRDFSTFGNFSLAYQNKYFLSGSARWDGSNLYGVRSNQKGVPLYSVGYGWNIHSEPFFQSDVINQLRWNLTYGYSGNTNKNVSTYTVITHGVNNTTGLPVAYIHNMGNPLLRWEKVQTINTSLTGAFFNNRISVSIEGYRKLGEDLIGNVLTDMTTGWDSEFDRPMLMNYASTRTDGAEMDLKGTYTIGEMGFLSSLSVAFTQNRVLRYYSQNPSAMASYAGSIFYPMEGYSVDQLYSLPWYGLNPQDGMPQVPDEEGQLYATQQDHTNFLRNLKFEDLVKNGVSTPRYQAFIRQHVKYRNWTLQASLSGKFGYYFRNTSLSYYRLFSSWSMHEDYLQRWQQPGDELHTNVPALPTVANNNSDSVYNLSELLVESGNHVRLNDVRISRSIPLLMNTKHMNLEVYLYGKDLGILWRANKSKVDPDYPSLSIPRGKRISFGVELNF